MSEDADAICREARERYEAALDADDANRTEALEDFRFRAGEQWPEAVKAAREADGKPCLTLNEIPQFVRQVTGDIRKNPPGARVRPVDDGADPAMAEVLTGLIRNIEAQSNAVSHYVQAADNQCIGGLGHFRVSTDYAAEDAWEQDISIKGIRNPMAVLWDPGAVEPTKADADYVFVTELVPRLAFEQRWPDASLDGWDGDGMGNWKEGDFIRVAEYWRKKPITRKLYLLGSGETLDGTGMEDAQVNAIAFAAGGIVREKRAKGHKVVMDLLNGWDVLEPQTKWAGRYLPIIPVLGEEVHIGERTVRHGMVRFMRDPAWIKNVHRSALVEVVAMSPKAKWIGTERQFEGREDEWADANRSNVANLTYSPDGAAPPPQRVAPDSPSAALLADLQMAAGDLERITGIHPAQLGMEGQEKSGRAIMARQRQGDTGTFVYRDNLATAVEHCARILVDLIPKIYDTQRIVRTLGEDGAEKMVQLNQQQPDGKRLNDPSIGRYDVVASSGPSWSTKREEAAEAMMELIAMPQVQAAGGDLLVKNLDFPGAEELSKRLRKMLPPGLAEPQPGDPPPQPPPPDPNMVLAQAEMMKAQVAGQREQAEAQIKMAELQLEQEKLRLEWAKLGQKGQNDAQNIDIKGAVALADMQHKAHMAMKPTVLPVQQPKPQSPPRKQ